MGGSCATLYSGSCAPLVSTQPAAARFKIQRSLRSLVPTQPLAAGSIVLAWRELCALNLDAITGINRFLLYLPAVWLPQSALALGLCQQFLDLFYKFVVLESPIGGYEQVFGRLRSESFYGYIGTQMVEEVYH